MGSGIGVPAELRADSIRALAVDLAGAAAKAFVDVATDVTIDADYDVIHYTPAGVPQAIAALDTYDVYVQG
jgi:hypothetical protein